MGRGGGQEPAMQLPTKYRCPAGAGGTQGSPGVGVGMDVHPLAPTDPPPRAGLTPPRMDALQPPPLSPPDNLAARDGEQHPRHCHVPPPPPLPPPALTRLPLCSSAPAAYFYCPPAAPHPAPSRSVQCLGCSFVWTLRYGIKVVLGCSAFDTPPPPTPALRGPCPLPPVLPPHPGEGSACELRGGGRISAQGSGDASPKGVGPGATSCSGLMPAETSTPPSPEWGAAAPLGRQ